MTRFCRPRASLLFIALWSLRPSFRRLANCRAPVYRRPVRGDSSGTWKFHKLSLSYSSLSLRHCQLQRYNPRSPLEHCCAHSNRCHALALLPMFTDATLSAGMVSATNSVDHFERDIPVATCQEFFSNTPPVHPRCQTFRHKGFVKNASLHSLRTERLA